MTPADHLDALARSAAGASREEAAALFAELGRLRDLCLARMLAGERPEPLEAVSIREAARTLGVSERFLYAHQDEIGVIRRGRRRVVPIEALRRAAKRSLA